ncbi:MAG: DUF488 family protein [Rhizomicrobium sp.]
MTLPFFTIGHSNRSLEEFVTLLRKADVALVADIRKMPRSRKNPQFNKETLHEALASFQIFYEHMAVLGGLRPTAGGSSEHANDLWTNKSFRNYADYALTEPFKAGIGHLLDEGRKQRCTVMCSEAVWWRCHRRIVADYLIANGETVFHIMGEGHLQRAQLTTGAVIQPDASIVYPARKNSSVPEQ